LQFAALISQTKQQCIEAETETYSNFWWHHVMETVMIANFS